MAMGVNQADRTSEGAVSYETAVADLDTLEKWLAARYAYAGRHPGFRAWIDDARRALPDSMPVEDFAEVVSDILVRFDDGHTKVPGISIRRAGLIRWIPPGEPFSAREVEEGIYHLAIPTMPDDVRSLGRLRRSIARMTRARGLIVDLRGNGGGARNLVHELVPHLMPPDARPLVASIAARRTSGPPVADPEGELADRGMYPAGSSNYGPAERSSIEDAMLRFAPPWLPAAGQIGPWHHLVIRPAPDPELAGVPVAVLIDEGCFSACDILAGALAELPMVRSFGSGTGGGSGRPVAAWLPHSGVRVQYSTMVSYRPDGTLYEDGIAPDVPVLVNPAVSGDPVAAAALDWLRGR